jgi:NitT/TauT family transport system ATP-binding protein
MTGIGMAERRKRAEVWLSRVGLANHGQKFPHQLSGGMKQRIQIARALVCDAPVLLMDEPFGALDAQTRTILQDELVSICSGSGATVLFITHDIAEAIILADRIGVMRAGPGSSIKDEFALDLPRPRNRGSMEFAAAYDRIQRVLGEEVKKVVLREAAA